MCGTEKTGSHWRKKAIWGHRKKRERWGDMTKLHSQALVLSFQPCFLFAARVFIWEARVLPHPDPMRTTVISTMETLCPPWMTDLSTQATRDPPPTPPSVSHPLHTCKKQLDCITGFLFRKQCSVTDMTKGFYTSNFRLQSRNVSSEGHVAALITGTGRFRSAPLMPCILLFFFLSCSGLMSLWSLAQWLISVFFHL